jgi:dipeptidyl aminopeptidase/acylaminoacyl peptidase
MIGILSNESGDTSKPIVIIVHGFASHKNTASLVMLLDFLQARDIASYRIDTFAHGESDGTFAELTLTEGVNDVLEAIEYVKSLGYKNIGLFGTSYGGCLALLAAAKSPDVKVLALKSPVSNFKKQMDDDIKGERMENWKKDGIMDFEDGGQILKLGYVFYKDFEKNNGWEVAPKVSIPTIIVHGNADEEVDVEQSRELVKLMPNAQLIEIDGADHRYSKPEDKEKMFTLIAAFLKSHFQTLDVSDPKRVI